MKRVLFLSSVLLVIFSSVQFMNAMPLVFKSTKELKAGGEIMTFDTSKYKNVRVGVLIVSGGSSEISSDIILEAVEGTDLIFLQSVPVYKGFPSRAVSIDNAPSKIKLTAPTAGVYKIFIWASN